MKPIKQLIQEALNGKKINTREEAESFVCQEIIIKKIANSELTDKILLKGGLLMYNRTKNKRRVTRDIDIDLIRYDIKNKDSILKLIEVMNVRLPEYRVEYVDHDNANQDNYEGIRLIINISDGKTTLKTKLDIGVHTLFLVEQEDTIFEFERGEQLKLKANPPEQIIAEKLYSIAKLGIKAATRGHDIFDVYYLITEVNINKEIVYKCFEGLTQDGKHGLKDPQDVINKISDVLENEDYQTKVMKSEKRWIDTPYNDIKSKIIDFIFDI